MIIILNLKLYNLCLINLSHRILYLHRLHHINSTYYDMITYKNTFRLYHLSLVENKRNLYPGFHNVFTTTFDSLNIKLTSQSG